MAALSGGQKAKALYDYEARAQDELSFKRHEIITVLGKDEEDEGWYIGTSSSGAKGLFPVNYVKVLEEAAAPSPAAFTKAPPAAAPAPTATAPAPAASPGAGASRSVGSMDGVRTINIAEEYELSELLGRGRFAHVRRCVQLRSGRNCVAKVMDLSDPELGTNKEEAEREVLAEVNILGQVDHPGVVRLLETIVWANKYHLVMEGLMGGGTMRAILAQFWRNSGAILRNYSDTASCSDLFDRIERLGPFAEEHAAALTAQVAAAVAYLHEKRIVHRDLKPDNLVFESSLPDSPIKLIDFGCARRAQLGRATRRRNSAAPFGAIPS